MKEEFTDLGIQAQILWYLYGKGAWDEMYTPFDSMIRRLSNIVKNNGKNIKKQTKNLVKKFLVLRKKQGDTISLNLYYKLTIKQFIHEQIGLDL